MKIAFHNIFGELKNAEQETLMRLKYVFEKQGHELLVIDRDGYIISQCGEKGTFIEDVPVDFIFTYNTTDFAQIALPDVFSVFAHWSPVGFVAAFQSVLELKMMNCYDYFGCTYESDVFKKYVQIDCDHPAFFGSSVPADFVIKPQKQKKRKLFYVGVNFERSLDKMRYGTLLEKLDKSGRLEIYGPKEVFGKANLWAGFDSYQGEIPFDGHTILKKINQAGVCLALNSPMHNDANAVSNRTYEAAAAGAVIISDDNEFVHKYFGNSVFYLDRDMSEEDASIRIMEILEWVNENWEKAYDMACRAQQAFLEKLTLDVMTDEFTKKTALAIEKVHDKGLQPDMIDVICFIDKNEDYFLVLAQLKRQFYQNLHLILVCGTGVAECANIPYPYDFISGDRNARGKAFTQAARLLQGKYFMFVDRESILHARHIYKNHEVLSQRSELFAYSGCYLKRTARTGKKYIVMSNKPILRNEFLLFRTVSNEKMDWHYRDRQIFFIETIFSRSAALFNREILQYVNDEELTLISDSVHLYLACCSLIKANQLGRFTYALTTGYWGSSVAETEKRVFDYPRRHWYSNSRSAKTIIKELNEVFFSYNFECDANAIRNRNFYGETTWYGEAPFTDETGVDAATLQDWVSKKRLLVRFLKKLLPKPVKEFVKKCVHA